MPLEIPEKFEKFLNAAPDSYFATRGTTRDDLRAIIHNRALNDQNAPQPGDPAPDLELEMLDAKGKRTGEFVQLSSYFGRPLGLIFGSYT